MIAIPVKKADKSSEMDDRFARCPFFCLFNPETGKIAFEKNTEAMAPEGVGPRVAEFLATKGVKQVFSREVGPKASRILDKLGIRVEMVNGHYTLQDILNRLNQ